MAYEYSILSSESYEVTVQQNPDAQRLGLQGKYVLHISPSGVRLMAAPGEPAPHADSSSPGQAHPAHTSSPSSTGTQENSAVPARKVIVTFFLSHFK